MTTYESLLITVPTLNEADEATLIDGLASVVTDGGGKIVARDRMGRRRLAYPIEKHDDGVYNILLYESDAAVPREIERRARMSDKVVRWLTVRLERDAAEQARDLAMRNIEARARAEEEAKARAEAEAAARVEAERKAEEEAARKAEEEAEQPAEAKSEDTGEPAAEAEAEASGDAPAEEAKPAEPASGE